MNKPTKKKVKIELIYFIFHGSIGGICGDATGYMAVNFGKKYETKILAKNCELESGIIYTYLYSKYHSTNGNGSQELHYLGIPIDIIYRFARVKRASFYASAG